MKEINKVLLINTHLSYPNWSEGKLNDEFHQVAKDFFTFQSIEVLETKVENGYIAEQEVEKHIEADVIILQTPVNWFGAPWIYKKYVDEVFNSGLISQKFLSGDGRTRTDLSKQYGSGGKLQEKKFMICATWNAPTEAFDNPAQQLLQGKGISDLFLNITSNYRFCGCKITTGYNCFDIFKNENIAKDLENYPAHLKRMFLDQ